MIKADSNYRNGYTEKEMILKELLEKIMEDPENIGITNNHFTNQWIQYDQVKKCFKYEDGVPLGDTPRDVIQKYRQLKEEGYGEWLDSAIWVVKKLVREIDSVEYKQYDKFPIETKKIINNKWNIDILNGENLRNSYKYFIYEDDDVRKIIKKSTDNNGINTIMVTTFNGKSQPHIDIIKYGEDNKIEKSIKIDAREDGYDYMEQIQSLYDAITMYERRGNKAIETRFFATGGSIEIKEKTIIGEKEKIKRILSYTFKNYKENPTVVSLMTDLSYTKYRRDDQSGLYSIEETQPFSFLRIFSTKKTLDKLEKELKVKYSVKDILVPILQKASDDNNGLCKCPVEPRTGLDCPEELRDILHEASVVEEFHNNQDKRSNVLEKINMGDLSMRRFDINR